MTFWLYLYGATLVGFLAGFIIGRGFQAEANFQRMVEESRFRGRR